MRKLVRQGLQFVLISGVGWLIDFGVFTLLSVVFSVDVVYANMLSAIPAVTFVFFVSGKKTFEEKPGKIKLWLKYLIYFGYQAVLLVIVSNAAQAIYDAMLQSGWWTQFAWIVQSGKVVAKLMITPITLVCNFFVMKLLIEKL